MPYDHVTLIFSRQSHTTPHLTSIPIHKSHDAQFPQLSHSEMAKQILIASFTILSLLLTHTASLPTETLTNAAETLSNSGYVAMSLTLSLTSNYILSTASSATIFSPPDSAFSDHGQPSLSLLLLHFSPLAFSEPSLRSLPFSTKIPTLSSTTSLTVTTASRTSPISLNNVSLTGSPIFDDGLLIVFGITDFFSPNFTLPSQTPTASPNFTCISESNRINSFSDHAFTDASGVLKSRGYSVMAYFLDLQLLGFTGKPNLTVFAPADGALVDYAGRVPEYPSLFLRHVVPCRFSWRDLVSIGNGTVVGTFLEEFGINVTRDESDGTVMVNNVTVTFPDMYYGEWLVVHGLRETLSVPDIEQEEIEEGDADLEFESPEPKQEESIAPDQSIAPADQSTAPDRAEF